MMKEYNIVRLKGNKMKIPEGVFEALNLDKYEYVLIETDLDEKESIISPLAAKGSNLVEMNLVLKNIPGAIAKVDLFLGENVINILYEEAEMINDDTAAAVRLVDMSKSKSSIEEIKKHLQNLDVVKDFEVIEV